MKLTRPEPVRLALALASSELPKVEDELNLALLNGDADRLLTAMEPLLEVAIAVQRAAIVNLKPLTLVDVLATHADRGRKLA